MSISSQFRLGKVKGCLLPDAACIDNAFIELADLSLFKIFHTGFFPKGCRFFLFFFTALLEKHF